MATGGAISKVETNFIMASDTIIFRGFLALILFTVSITIMKSFELTDVIAEDSIGNVPIEEMKALSPEPLEHEKIFTDTLKDCMPTAELNGSDNKRKKECKTFVPEGSKERIAIMAPPGKIDASLVKFIRVVLRRVKNGDDREFASTNVEVVPTTNMVSV